MFNLNLLSEKEKQESRFEIYCVFLFHLIKVLAVFILIFFALLSPTFIFLYSHQSDIEEQIRLELEAQKKIKIEELESAVGASNRLITLVYDVDKGLKRVNPVLYDIYGIAGGLVLVRNLIYSVSDKKLEIRGEAKTIQNFLDFRAKLRELPYFSEVESPPENLVKLLDLNFVLTGKFK